MRCFSCNRFSLEAICKDCADAFFTPEITIKKLDDLEVVSFFDYYVVVDFIKSKYTNSGHRVYKFLAKKYFNPFLKNYIKNVDSKKVYLIGVNEDTTRGYSVISILTRYSAKGVKGVLPLHNALKAKNKVQYAGKSLKFRQRHPRDFVYNGPKNIDAILIDDTITTGTTLKEAFSVLKANNVNVHFALTLSVAKDGIDI